MGSGCHISEDNTRTLVSPAPRNTAHFVMTGGVGHYHHRVAATDFPQHLSLPPFVKAGTLMSARWTTAGGGVLTRTRTFAYEFKALPTEMCLWEFMSHPPRVP